MRTSTLLSGAICFSLGMATIHLSVLPVASADLPATQPTDEPAADAPMRVWFWQLADPDPKVRDKARVDLMGIPAGDLPKLRQLVIDNRPMSPTQVAALREIVLQSFLAEQTYESADENHDQTNANGNQAPYFLGVRWPNFFVNDQEEARFGVPVDDRLPGLPSYRFLRRGDMIQGVYKNPDVSLQELPNFETHTRKQLVDAIGSLPILQNVVLQVLRNGESIRVPVRMAPRPNDANEATPGSIESFIGNRADSAEKYWQENFAPLVEPRIDTSNLAEAP